MARILRNSAVLCVASALAFLLGDPWLVGRSAVGAGPKRFDSLRLAVEDLTETFGPAYPRGREYLRRLDGLKAAVGTGDAAAGRELEELRREALLDNPLLDFDRLIVLERKRGQLGLPTNHQCNACLNQSGYDNEIAVLSLKGPEGRIEQQRKLETLFRPPGGFYVGEIDLHFDADRLLFTMPNGRTWQIHEIGTDGSGLRQVSREEPDVDNFDACYLPDGRIVFASTASFTGVPCWHGKERACSLYRMNADGSAVRQLCFDQDLDLHPAVLGGGQVIYSRWDYTGTMHMYLRPLMVMNPDGSAQRAVYGTNSYYPNALYFPRPVSGSPTKLAAVLSGYHGVNRAGELVVIDTTVGWQEADGIVRRIMHRGEPPEPVIRDRLVVDAWPKFLHPAPLSEKYFIAAVQPDKNASWGIYLVDAFDNMVPLCVDARHDYFEPVPLKKTPKPPAIPDRTDPSRDDAVVYLHDIYAGPGLAGVPHGAVERLRVVGYHFGYPGLAGPDKVGCGGPWEVMRILGTVPVERDGSAKFRVPANTPITLQPLDDQGKALQLMRSWYTAMPGETASCVGCHERPKETPIVRDDLAASRPPSAIEPWYGPARGFDFEREVQPVLDEHCTSCHHGGTDAAEPDLRAERFFPDYQGRPLTKLGADRLEPELVAYFGGRRVRYTPAYEALVPYIRRVGIEDDVHMLVPAEYHADTSELVQMLQEGHHGVRLDREAWDRLVTWIDLNGPCHGSWNDVAPVPGRADRRRHELARHTGGPAEDFEQVPDVPRREVTPVIPVSHPTSTIQNPTLPGWPFDAGEARRRQAAAGKDRLNVELAEGVTLELVRVPAGRFVMGDADGEADEGPPRVVSIDRGFWMGTTEITNAQYRTFDPDHDPRYFMKRYPGIDGPGLSLDGPDQPVVRVSWDRAVAFCEWLSEKTGRRFRLPSEAEWEYACRAGTATPLWYGTADDDFSPYANMADRALGTPPPVTGGLTSSITAAPITGIMRASVYGGDIPCVEAYDDGAVATSAVAHYRPNPWGLYDTHGNAAEWTLSPYSPTDPRKTVRGGSFHDRPPRCRSAYRLAYPPWQRVHNVGFRVVCDAREIK